MFSRKLLASLLTGLVTLATIVGALTPTTATAATTPTSASCAVQRPVLIHPVVGRHYPVTWCDAKGHPHKGYMTIKSANKHQISLSQAIKEGVVVPAKGPEAAKANAVTPQGNPYVVCWSTNITYEYTQLGYVVWWVAPHITWCSFLLIEIYGTPSQYTTIGVTGFGSWVEAWEWKGFVTQYIVTAYDRQYAHAVVEGHFAQCPIMDFACYDNHYPLTERTVYANGDMSLPYWRP